MPIEHEQDAPQSPTEFEHLSPDEVINAVEALGFRSDGRLLALNSYENRVYRVGLEEKQPLIVKFYRPGRLSQSALLEEHAFARELADAEIPVVAPSQINGETLFQHNKYSLAVYPMKGGRSPELDNPEQLRIIGRFLGQLHLVGESGEFKHRPQLNVASLGSTPSQRLLKEDRLPIELRTAYAHVIDDLLGKVNRIFEETSFRSIRLHGDFHPGNILWRDELPHIVDLDDSRTGPAIQDLWLFLSGDKIYQRARLMDLLEGYSTFRAFSPGELKLVEALRTLRIIHYAAWLDQRREEQAFRQAFPWLGGARFWDDHMLLLKEQSALLDETPLQLEQFH